MNTSREREIHDIKTDFIKLSFLNKIEFIKSQISLLDDLIEISNKTNHYKNNYNENILPNIKSLKVLKKILMMVALFYMINIYSNAKLLHDFLLIRIYGIYFFFQNFFSNKLIFSKYSIIFN